VKLARYERDGDVRLGLVEGEEIVDLTAGGLTYPTMMALIAAGDAGLAAVRMCSRETRHPLADVRLLAPVERPGKYLGIGMNYQKHLEEADRQGVPRSAKPVWFNKQTTCLSGLSDPIDPGVTE